MAPVDVHAAVLSALTAGCNFISEAVCAESGRLLSQPQHICFMSHQAVLSVHDTVAQKNFDPVLPPLPDDFEDELEEESVKIVRLVKNKEPLVGCWGCE